MAAVRGATALPTDAQYNAEALLAQEAACHAASDADAPAADSTPNTKPAQPRVVLAAPRLSNRRGRTTASAPAAAVVPGVAAGPRCHNGHAMALAAADGGAACGVCKRRLVASGDDALGCRPCRLVVCAGCAASLPSNPSRLSPRRRPGAAEGPVPRHGHADPALNTFAVAAAERQEERLTSPRRSQRGSPPRQRSSPARAGASSHTVGAPTSAAVRTVVGTVEHRHGAHSSAAFAVRRAAALAFHAVDVGCLAQLEQALADPHYPGNSPAAVARMTKAAPPSPAAAHDEDRDEETRPPRNWQGLTPLHVAVRVEGRANMVRWLLQHPATVRHVNAKDTFAGTTALARRSQGAAAAMRNGGRDGVRGGAARDAADVESLRGLDEAGAVAPSLSPS